MSIIWLDGFDLYADVNGLARRGYTGQTASPNNFNTSGGRFGGGALRLDGNANPINFSAAVGDTYSVGFAINPQNSISSYGSGCPVMTFRSGGPSGTVINQVGIDNTGKIRVSVGSGFGTVIADSAGGLIAAGVWNHIEAVITRHASAGAVEIFLNGTSVISVTGVNSGSATPDNVTIGDSTGANPGNQRYIDDIFVTNTAAQVGDCKVETIHPSADTATKDWTRSTGSNNFANVDDVPSDDDSTYNSSATATNKDLFDMSDLVATPSVIKCVQTVMISRKDDAATRELRTNMKNGTTTTNGTTRGQGTSYSNFTDLYQVNPDTASAWTLTDINAMQLGYEVVT